MDTTHGVVRLLNKNTCQNGVVYNITRRNNK